jgi:hypothetical protein
VGIGCCNNLAAADLGTKLKTRRRSKMVDVYIIDQARQRDREEKRAHQTPRMEMPVYDPDGHAPASRPSEEDLPPDAKRGVVTIPY